MGSRRDRTNRKLSYCDMERREERKIRRNKRQALIQATREHHLTSQQN
jgi:hypothetical protein